MERGTEPVTLRTARLLLDQPRPDDAGAIARICGDPAIGRWIPVLPKPYRLEHAEHFVHVLVPQGWATGEQATWLLRLPDGEPIGSVSARDDVDDIGYWLASEHRGRGFMTEAVRAVLDHRFSTGRRRVLWECLAGNRASARVARAVGFRYLGEGPSRLLAQQPEPPASWHAVLLADEPRAQRGDWPV